MRQCILHVTFQFRNTYPGIEECEKEGFAILTGSRLHDKMSLNMNLNIIHGELN